MSKPALTDIQRRIAARIAKARGMSAFVPQLVEWLGYAAESSLTPTLKIMERNGFIEIQGGGAARNHRLVRLTRKCRQALGIGGLPLVGKITAGPLREALADAEEFVESTELLPHKAGDFLLRVTGDSMIGDGICDGDLVLLRPGEEVRPGEIAAAYVGDAFEATLKHVHPERNGVRLRASNPAYADMIVPRGEWRGVAGVYRGLVRHAG